MKRLVILGVLLLSISTGSSQTYREMSKNAHDLQVKADQEAFLQVITTAAFARECGVFNLNLGDQWLLNQPSLLTGEEEVTLSGPRMSTAIADGKKKVREIGCHYWKDHPETVVAIRQIYGE